MDEQTKESAMDLSENDQGIIRGSFSIEKWMGSAKMLVTGCFLEFRSERSLEIWATNGDDFGNGVIPWVSHESDPLHHSVSTTRSSSCGGSDLEGINKAFDELDKNFDDSLSEDEMTSCPPAV